MSFQAMTWAITQRIPASQKIVLIVLANYANEKGACWPSLQTIAKDAGISKRTAMRTVEKLIENKIISVKKRRRSTGNQTSSYYQILPRFMVPIKAELDDYAPETNDIEPP